ncbi:hypothetical protein BBD42_06170 [Paenibacillus sp. BIHB 4019]|uniref:Uncharacterized protein n=1 Tax=Paenibacillus sp. BIHB 4019 TaxID=1870819 RepID=A0A1B2DED6_9BACL|nr:hypothetical protein BBD42_06170 [Paenibacillus sp. BIHB 4019]
MLFYVILVLSFYAAALGMVFLACFIYNKEQSELLHSCVLLRSLLRFFPASLFYKGEIYDENCTGI